MLLFPIFSALRNVTQLKVTSLEHFPSKNLAPTRGKGAVRVHHEGTDHLVFYERGTWETGHLVFSNIYEWTFDHPNQMIRLGHRRFGLNSTEHLVHFTTVNGRQFRAQCPYFCGKDSYEAELSLDLKSSVVQLSWIVIKPKFRYSLLNEYSCEF
jgi:hypothetical protein